MSENLYGLLGLCAGAHPDTVRAAYRRRAKETHPDVGGSAEAFAAVERAYRVLSDPQARKRYDLTGEIEERSADNQEAAALGIIGNMLVSIIGSHNHNAGDPLAAMRHSLAQNISQAQNTIGDLRGSVARCEKLSARFKTKNVHDPIGGMIGSQIANMRMQIENHRQAIATMERAQAILKDYEFEAEVAMPSDHQMLQMMRSTQSAQQASQSGWFAP